MTKFKLGMAAAAAAVLAFGVAACGQTATTPETPAAESTTTTEAPAETPAADAAATTEAPVDGTTPPADATTPPATTP